jgi:hypothetical protein
MASNDEYQHRDFWKTIKEELDKMPDVCVEQAADGACLMSARMIILDFSEPVKKEQHADKNV